VSKEEAYGALATPNQRSRFYLYCRQQGLWPQEVAGFNPHTQPKAFDAFCPVRNVTPEYPPTLLLHGDADTDVPFAQSEQMARELERHRVLYEFIRIPGGPHGFDGTKDPRAGPALDAVLGFLRQRLR
jgi:dipeptidyl aminopeptidase/acylaminoacyl peptidase